MKPRKGVAEHHTSQNTFDTNYRGPLQAFWEAQLFPIRTEEWGDETTAAKGQPIPNSGCIQRGVAIPQTAFAKHSATCGGPG